jgi:hypothetical protein
LPSIARRVLSPPPRHPREIMLYVPSWLISRWSMKVVSCSWRRWWNSDVEFHELCGRLERPAFSKYVTWLQSTEAQHILICFVRPESPSNLFNFCSVQN